MALTLNQTRIYVGDSQWLGKKVKFKTRSEMDQFRNATKSRIADLSSEIVRRVMQQ